MTALEISSVTAHEISNILGLLLSEDITNGTQYISYLDKNALQIILRAVIVFIEFLLVGTFVVGKNDFRNVWVGILTLLIIDTIFGFYGINIDITLIIFFSVFLYKVLIVLLSAFAKFT